MAVLTLEGLRFQAGGNPILKGVDLSLGEGEFLALLGPSGCGKSTLLRLIAGFEAPSEGRIRLDGREVSGPGLHLPPEKRGIGMVFQSYALWPHLSVQGNVGYALKLAGLTRAEQGARIEEALERVGLRGFGARAIQNLSGGQRQRVALARCLAMRPRLLLLDEPLANLDTHLREVMVEELRRLHRQSGATIIHVTHDQTEAMALADRIAVMEQGAFLQLDTPKALWREPQDARVAAFIGRGQLVDLEVLGPGAAPGRLRVSLWERELELRGPEGLSPGPARACLRRAGLRLTDPRDPEGIPARVLDLLPQGGNALVSAQPIGQREPLRLESDAPLREGEMVRLRVSDGWVLPRG